METQYVNYDLDFDSENLFKEFDKIFFSSYFIQLTTKFSR